MINQNSPENFIITFIVGSVWQVFDSKWKVIHFDGLELIVLNVGALSLLNHPAERNDYYHTDEVEDGCHFANGLSIVVATREVPTVTLVAAVWQLTNVAESQSSKDAVALVDVSIVEQLEDRQVYQTQD